MPNLNQPVAVPMLQADGTIKMVLMNRKLRRQKEKKVNRTKKAAETKKILKAALHNKLRTLSHRAQRPKK